MASAKNISTTDTAKIIRQELKVNFPGVKFSVRSDSYSGGSSVDVFWTDGPTQSEVDAIISKFQGASFDGMTDMKSHHTSTWNGEQVQWGPDFVHGYRSYSKEFMEEVAKDVAEKYGKPVLEVIVNTYKNRKGELVTSNPHFAATTERVGEYYLDQFVHKKMSEKSLYVAPNQKQVQAKETEAIAPAPAPVTLSDIEITVTENEEKDGVEIRFSANPGTEVTSCLDKNGFKFSRRKCLWYAKRSELTLAFAYSLVATQKLEEEVELEEPVIEPQPEEPTQIECDLPLEYIGKEVATAADDTITVTGVKFIVPYYDETQSHWEYELSDGRTLDLEDIDLLINPIKPVVQEKVEPIFFVNSKFAKLNKNSTLDEYKEQCERGEYNTELCGVEEWIELSDHDYDRFINNLMNNYPWLDGKGGTDSNTKPQREVEHFYEYTQEEQEQYKNGIYTVCLAVGAPNRETILVDPEGYSYARYVGLVDQKDIAPLRKKPTPSNVLQFPTLPTPAPVKPKRKGLRVEVYSDRFGDCTNNGISSYCKSLTLVGDGIPQISDVSEDAPAIIAKVRVVNDKEYLYCEPLDNLSGKPFTNGGNFIYSSDSRFSSLFDRRPIAIHDRQE